MTPNVTLWKYKNRQEISNLTNELLNKEWSDLVKAIKEFNKYRIPLTDEMFWLFVTINNEITLRKTLNANYE